MTRDEIMRNSKNEGGMFVVIPSVVQLDAGLPLSAKMLYGIITWRCNSYAYTWATNRELGEDLGVSPKRVSALLSLLEESGHVETEIEYKNDTNEILHRYIYPIMKSARSIARGGALPENEDTPPSERAYPSPGTRTPLPENEEVICNINKQKENKKDPPYSPPEGDKPAGEAEEEDKPQADPKSNTQPKPKRSRRDKAIPDHDPEAFETFWAAYPRKDNRKKSIEAWDKLKPDKGLCRVMYDALKRQRRDPQWAEEGGKYIPMFSTWLNQRRWENQGVDLSLLQTAPHQSAGGWAPDPEVTQ